MNKVRLRLNWVPSQDARAVNQTLLVAKTGGPMEEHSVPSGVVVDSPLLSLVIDTYLIAAAFEEGDILSAGITTTNGLGITSTLTVPFTVPNLDRPALAEGLGFAIEEILLDDVIEEVE